MLKVTSVSWEGDEAQTPQDGVLTPSELQHVCATLVKQEGITWGLFSLNECMRIFQEGAAVNEDGCTGPPAAVFMAENEYVVLSADTFLALSYTQSEEVRRIERRNNCVMKADVKVEFAKGEGEGDPQKALSEFKAFIGSLGGPPHSSVVPPGRPHPGESNTQTRIHKEVFSGLRWGDVPKASLWTTQPKAGAVKMDIDDPLFRGGITMEKSCWKLMTTSYSEYLLKVQKIFSVRFEADHSFGPGKVRVRAAGSKNAALEIDAVRELFQLYKSIVITPFTTNQPGGATGFTGPDPPKNAPKRDRGNPQLNGQSADSVLTKNAMVEAAAGGGGHQEDRCPICLDTFEDKRELACKHEFCHGCLVQSIKNLGPCCPVCKHVFGNMVGNQPEGTMTATTITKSLPGFPKCGTIVITYDIPSGRQTVNIQNIWKHFELCFNLPLFSFHRKNTQILECRSRVLGERRICQTTKRVRRCCSCCRGRSLRGSFSPLDNPEQRAQRTR